jgi:WD40 repeat protein
LWNDAAPTPDQSFGGHIGEVSIATWSQHDQMLTVGDDCTVRIWDLSRQPPGSDDPDGEV